MKTLIPLMVEELGAGHSVGLATVLASKGSAPRGAGACMLLREDGSAAGTVGGGVLERRALDELQALLTMPSAAGVLSATADAVTFSAGAGSGIAEYALTQNDVQSLGMVCGGNVSLLYQRFAPDTLPFWRAMQASLGAGRNLWLVRTVRAGAVVALSATDGTTNLTGIAQATLFPLCQRKPAWQAPSAGADGYLVEPVVLQSHAYLFGGGHVAQCVAPLLHQLDFSPVIYDDRPAFANRDLFPTAAEVVCAPFAEAGQRLHIARHDEIVIMTRGHVNDLAILTQALHTPAYYIGLIGSRSKIAYTRELLLNAGFTSADFDRVHTPIGLPIQAETPMEIAVSVAAEMILCRAQHAAQESALPA